MLGFYKAERSAYCLKVGDTKSGKSDEDLGIRLAVQIGGL